MEDVRETGRSAVGVYLMDLDDDDRVVSVASIAREEAEAAHEQAAARKAEETEQKAEREGTTLIKKVEDEPAPAADAVEDAPKTEGTPDQIKDLIQRADAEAADNNTPKETDSENPS
jgi:DNA gyrase/topoisomerase IV subunit A